MNLRSIGSVQKNNSPLVASQLITNRMLFIYEHFAITIHRIRNMRGLRLVKERYERCRFLKCSMMY